ncbi:MAG: rhodanese-like domain-containing protein [Solirubrobacteraceae bacterium]
MHTITARTVADEFFTGGVMILDIRSEVEWTRVRVPGATHIPLGQLPRRFNEVRTDRPIAGPVEPGAFLCRSGHRSMLAARWAARDCDDVARIAGGMNAWLAAGLPAARCAPPPTRMPT